MSVASDKAFAYIAGVEGTLSMDPKDRGNWTGGQVGAGQLCGTKYGISSAAHPTVDIANLTFQGAAAIFESEYWQKVRGDELPYPIALCLVDDAYNHGANLAVCNLQHALKIAVDGAFGPQTLAVAQAAAHADIRGLVRDFQTERALDYARDPDFAREGRGWFRERVIGTALEAFTGEGS